MLARAAALVLAALTVGCRREPPPAPAASEPEPAPSQPAPPAVDPAEMRRWSWEARAGAGAAAVTQTALGGGRCRVASSGGAEPWSSDECLGDAMRLRFVSPDGRRVMAFDALPLRGDDWSRATVMQLYDRGQLVTRTTAGALVGDDRKLQNFSTHFAWLRGSGGLPGQGPHYTADGAAVEGESASGRPFHFGFDGSGIPPAAAAPASPPARPVGAQTAAPGSIISWTDDDGETHFTNDANSVPARYRARAKTTEGADIQVLAQAPGEPPSTSPSGPPAGPTRATRPPPPAAPKASRLYCVYRYVGKRGYCTWGTLAEATAKCLAAAKARYGQDVPCECTDDAAFVASSCR